MRIAIAGKGGSGKTTIAAALARLLARTGWSVLAIDADSNPNLGIALGMGAQGASRAQPLPAEIVSRRLDGPALKEPVEAVFERHGLEGPDGVRLALMGMPTHAEEGCLCSAHATVSAVLGDAGERPGMATICDLEASPEHLSRGTARHVDALVLVAEPYYRSLETVRRLAALATELPIPRLGVVANKLRTETDADAVAAFCARYGLEHLASVPWSEAVTEADRDQAALVDADGGGQVVAAIDALAQALLTHAGSPLARSPSTA
jgi:CO dehydrogenase maturation factor